MDPIELVKLVAIGQALALDLIAFIRRRHAESGQLPTDAEVVAAAKAKITAIVAEGEAALQEFPETPAPPPAEPGS